ncbi:MAG: PAS domain-containing protein [Chthoniobacterales bacterium]|nr:PAS domain-containing protein [Chthoniobacterales bacterium]
MRFAREIHHGEQPTQTVRREKSDGPATEKLNHEIHAEIAQSCAPSPEEYSTIVARATNDAVRDWNLESGTLTWPQGLERLLGYAPSKATDRLGFWQKHLHPEDRARNAASVRDALASKAETWSGEYRFRRSDHSYVHLLERACIMRDADGTAVRFVGSLMDISARKQLQDQLCRSQKMEAFGQLAGGVAHDFNNFLTTILGYSDLLLHELGVKNSVAAFVREIRNAASRASTLSGQLLAFSRRNPLEPRIVDVNALVSNLERSLLRLLGENIAVECHLLRNREGAHVEVDPGQITQVILNIVVNARDAMSSGGRLLVETSVVTIADDDPATVAFEQLTPGDYVAITVRDSGVGMSADVKAHLFEPFFTTKSEHRSSGLGLATSYGIVRQSGGGIGVQSDEERGTTVTIFLPRVDAPPAQSHKKTTGKKLPTGSERILVLEDDVSVRHISVRILRGLGYDVIEAANGDDAQRLVAQENGDRKIDLLLTDMVMPHMSGRRFADWLREARPTTKVIFVSGYLEESLHPGDRRDGEMFFLAKPFDPEQLASKIREALDS